MDDEPAMMLKFKSQDRKMKGRKIKLKLLVNLMRPRLI